MRESRPAPTLLPVYGHAFVGGGGVSGDLCTHTTRTTINGKPVVILCNTPESLHRSTPA